MKKIYFVSSLILALIIAKSFINIKDIESYKKVNEPGIIAPFALTGSVQGNDINKDSSKAQQVSNISSRGSSLPAPDNSSIKIKLNVYIQEKKQTTEMNLEEYICGVVAGEMPADFNFEALKAQAVAARTYTAARMKSFSGNGCSNHPGADICTDSTHCQEWVSKIDPRIREAVETTCGLILTYDSLPVMYPLFFSTSSGRTENSQDIFSGSYPYLKSVLSPYEEEAPKHLTKTTISIDQFIKKFNSYGAKLDKKKLTSQVKVTARTEGGSVKTIQIGSKQFSGVEVRKILSLNSPNFNIDFNAGNIVITVLGYGHGVGMSQWGANAMGKGGSTFDDILKHYYQGTEIVRISDIRR